MPAHSDDINVNNQAIKLVQAAIVQDKAKKCISSSNKCLPVYKSTLISFCYDLSLAFMINNLG